MWQSISSVAMDGSGKQIPRLDGESVGISTTILISKKEIISVLYEKV